MSSFASAVVALLVDEFGTGNTNEACPKARMLAETLKDIIQDAEDGAMEMTKEEGLELDEEEYDPSWIMPDGNDDEESILATPGRTEYRFGDQIVDKRTVEKALEFYRSPDKGFRSFESMTSRYRWIKTKDHMKRIREIEEKRVKRQEKIDGIKDELLVWTLQNMKAGVPLHDFELRVQALNINRTKYQLAGFVCSHGFLQRFKKQNRISSRKVTRFVSKKSVVDKDKLDAVAKKFVEEVKDFVKKENIPLDAIVNGDQSGFVKEMHAARSLALVGERHVFRVANSVSSTTHSCTVLPQVTAAGTLRDKTCVVLQEPGGRLPAKGHFQSNNLIVYAGNSHIMTKQLMIRWLTDCVLTPDLPPVSLLILDSWSPFLDHQEIQKHVPPGKKVFIKNIPPGCTPKVQPLDVYFFLHIKKIMKRISLHVLLQGLDFPVHRRDNLLKCISQVFWMIAHPRFSDFLRYAWHASGYIDRPAPFDTPAQYVFSTTPDCDILNCKEFSFVRCPHCQKSICFKCFFINVHRC